MADEKVLAVSFGDLHVGSSTALCPPEVPLDDGGSYKASPLQLWFWQCWQQLWNHIRAEKDRLGCRVWALVGGDEIEGDHHHITEIWFTNQADQDKALLQIYAGIEDVVDRWVFVRGTRAHDGPGAARTEARLRTLLAKGYDIIGENANRLSHWVWTGIISQVKVQVKHQPSTTSRVPYLYDAAASRQALYLAHEYYQAGVPPPDIAIFHHAHICARGNHGSTTCFFVPSWQAIYDFSGPRRATKLVVRPGALLLYISGSFWHGNFYLFDPGIKVWTES